MSLKIEYAVDVIAGVLLRGDWGWYVSDKALWVMDQVKYRQAFVDAGYEPAPVDVGSDRFHIPVLNEETAERFLAEMRPHRVDKAALSEELLRRQPASSSDDIIDLCPSLFVNFDGKVFKSLYPEPTPFEDYVPAGWYGAYEDFLDEIPPEHRYWVINGRDYFQPFLSDA